MVTIHPSAIVAASTIVLGVIDLTGHIFLPASGSFILLNGGFFLRGPGGQQPPHALVSHGRLR